MSIAVADVLRDVIAFTEHGAGSWRLSELRLPAIERLAANDAPTSEGRMAAVEDALEAACHSIDGKFRDVALTHLGFAEEGRGKSRTERENEAAKKIAYEGTSYRRTHPRDGGLYPSWRMKTLTLVAEALLAQPQPQSQASDLSDQSAAASDSASSVDDLPPPVVPSGANDLPSRAIFRRTYFKLGAAIAVVGGGLVTLILVFGGNAAKPTLSLEGSVGVANITAGDHKYESSVLAKDGDEVEFYIFGRNREITKTIEGLRVNYSLASLDNSQADFRIRFSGGGVIPQADEAQVIPEDGQKATLEIERVPVVVKLATANGGHDSFKVAMATAAPGSVAIPLVEPQAGRDAFSLVIRAKVHTK